MIVCAERGATGATVLACARSRHHGVELPRWANGIDPYSSAYYFDGWDDDSFRRGLDPPPDGLGAPVAPAETWFLTSG